VVNYHTAHCRLKRLLIGSFLSVGLAGVASAQNDDTQLANFSALLKKKAALEVNIAHMELELQTQAQTIEKLEAEIVSMESASASVPALVENMINSYAEEFEKDPPFNASERFERLAKLQEQLEDGSSTPQSMLSRAIGMYEAEVNYGMTVEQYPGDHPMAPREDDSGSVVDDGHRTAAWRVKACTQSLKNPDCNVTNEMSEAIRERTGKSLDLLDEADEIEAAKLKQLLQSFVDDRKLLDGNYLRVGRLALVYADVDGQEVWIYDVKGKRGLNDSATEQIDLFRAVKMAKGEAAVDVMAIPVVVQ